MTRYIHIHRRISMAKKDDIKETNNDIIREGLLTKFISKIFGNIIAKKTRLNKKALKTDPKIAKATEKFEKSATEYIDFLKNLKTKPDSKSKLAQIRKHLD